MIKDVLLRSFMCPTNSSWIPLHSTLMKWNKPPPKNCFPPPKFFIPLDWIPDGMAWNVEYRWIPGQSRWNLF